MCNWDLIIDRLTILFMDDPDSQLVWVALILLPLIRLHISSPIIFPSLYFGGVGLLVVGFGFLLDGPGFLVVGFGFLLGGF